MLFGYTINKLYLKPQDTHPIIHEIKKNKSDMRAFPPQHLYCSHYITTKYLYNDCIVTVIAMPPENSTKSKFEVYGEEMIEKEVKPSGNSGRVYLPPDWVGKHVKIIRID